MNMILGKSPVVIYENADLDSTVEVSDFLDCDCKQIADIYAVRGILVGMGRREHICIMYKIFEN